MIYNINPEQSTPTLCKILMCNHYILLLLLLFRRTPSPPSQNMQLQIVAKPSVLCCHLANTNTTICQITTVLVINIII